MRVVTRPDFDGVVCAALLMDALEIAPPVLWVQPSEVQHRRVDIQPGDVIANLPYHENCALWFDHHVSNRPQTQVEGAFKIAPSAAGVIYEHYRERFTRDYDELIHQTDRIDSADLILDEILRPEKHPHVLLSMTITSKPASENSYWEHLVSLIRNRTMDEIMEDPQVKQRCEKVITENIAYEKALRECTTMVGSVSVTDFRGLDPTPKGNRFLIYSLFPDCVVNVKVLHDGERSGINVGHSILNRNCHVNVGKMLSRFDGGGHVGAGACRFPRQKTDDYLERIVQILLDNEPD